MNTVYLQLGQAMGSAALSAEPGSLEPLVRSALEGVPTFMAVLIRMSSMFIFAPLFGSARIPKRIRVMLALVLSCALAPTIGPVTMPSTIYSVAVGVGGELIFGLAMGTVMSFTFIAAQWAGEVIGQQLGFNLGAVFDPQYGGGGSVISDLLFMLTLVIFLSLQGHHAMLMGLRDSFTVLPPFTVGVGAGGIELLSGLMNSCTILAIRLCAPTLVAMLVSDVALGFISKTMPQLNVMSAGTSVRGLLGMFILTAGLVFTNDTLSNSVLDSMDRVRTAWVTDWRSH